MAAALVASVASVALAAMAGPRPAGSAAPRAPEAQAPRPLPGLWSMTIRLNDRPPTTLKICIGRTVPEAWRQFFGDAAKATDPACTFRRASEGGRLTVSRFCTIRDGNLVHTQEISSVVSARRIHVAMTTATRGEGRGVVATPPQRMVEDGVYLSPCPPAMKEGQVQLPDGTITDPLTMIREAGEAAARELKGLGAKPPQPSLKAAPPKRRR